jgi:hypothetical protein
MPRLALRRVNGQLSPAFWRLLCDLQVPGDENDRGRLRFEHLCQPMPLEAAWRFYGAAATAAHARVHPGHRPVWWWRWSAPERELRQLAGTGRRAAMLPLYGLPVFAAVDEDPPLFESSAMFLRRHGLLLPGERPAAADFRPVPAPLLADLLEEADEEPD